MKKIILILLVLFITPFSYSSENPDVKQTSQITDGPYIFWKTDNILIEYILEGSVVTQDFPKKTGTFMIEIPGFEQEFEITSYPYPIPKWKIPNVEKFIAISDIHGQFERFTEILRGNGVIDEKLNWSWQNGHLIVLGDVFDRGAKVTEALWLIHKLSRQAKSFGGDVHYLLGNHELMILQNDLRYIHDKYSQVSELLDKDYAKLYDVDSELGKWLRSLNTAMVIGDVMFVHGGISPKVFEKGPEIQQLNSLVRNNLDKETKNEISELLFGSHGPFWYRGYFQDGREYKQIAQDSLLSLLNKLKIENIVVGHTTQDFINPFFREKVIPIDTGIKYGDMGEALIWEEGIFYRAKADGSREQLIFK